MNYRITYTVLAFDFYLELKFAKKKKDPVLKIKVIHIQKGRKRFDPLVSLLKFTSFHS